ncbi:MAG TPA: hypothetical protein VH560_07395 [Polyangia bacterium]|nr:hypothetical protein [Polyangia bacterium]
MLCALALSCYKPQIQDGGFLCATSGQRCPDGFSCYDNHCSRSPATQPQKDASTTGDAATESMCASPPVTALCATVPAASDACNPTCQTGCACGRCNVVGDAPACVPSGTVQLGGICRPGDADNCGPGLICLTEACGNGLARCYQHCTDDAQCKNTICTIPIEDAKGINTRFKTCDVPPSACNPVSNSGCPDPAFNCYITSTGTTLCDCPSSPDPTKLGKNGATCDLYNDCAPEFVCINLDGNGPRCHFACDVTMPSCPNMSVDGGIGSPAQCVPSGAGSKYGYCNI